MFTSSFRLRLPVVVGVVFSAATGTWATPYSDLIIADGAAGYWNFNETSGTTILDQTGLHADGVGNPTQRNVFYQSDASSYAINQAGNPLYLEGANRAAHFIGGAHNTPGNENKGAVSASYTPTHPFTLANNFSIEGWVNADASADSYGTTGQFFATRFFGLGINENRKLHFVTFGRRDWVLSGGPDVPRGEWHHVVATYGNGDGLVQFFLDGSFVGSILDPGQTTANTTDFNFWAIGRRVSVAGSVVNTSNQFQGFIDELSIFPYVLTPTQVLAHYNATFQGSAAADVPEPTCLALLGFAALGLRRRRTA